MDKKVLIVDDDQYIRELYEEVLRNEGCTVETAVDGLDGLQKLQQGGYDLVLLDVMMPHLDGLEVLEKLKADPNQVTNGPIIFVTNLSHDQVAKDALNKGAASYIIKTDYTPEQLVEFLQKYLK